MKTCKICKATKPASSFYKMPSNSDGRSGKCKECTKEYMRQRRLGPDGEKMRAYDRKRGNRQKPSYGANYRKAFPKKYKAQTMVGNAVRDGKMKRMPCEICGSKNRVHAHHDDYDFPLSVRWLCTVHHARWHAENGEGKNAK